MSVDNSKYGLILEKKTGFKNTRLDVPIIIDDFRGINFYDSRNVKKPVEKFNLPAGKYVVKSGYFKSLPVPVKFAKNKLPVRERMFKPNPKNFDILFRPTKHKAFISWKEKIIVFDPALKGRKLNELFYILFHEYAHQFYVTESKTDALAENMMIDEGFNPSQIHSAIVTVLSDRQKVRKARTVKRLIDKI